MAHFPKYPVLTVLLLCTAITSFSQTPSLRFRHLTTKQGLPSNKVLSIIKDHNGFVWFGTSNGLARFDGYQIKTYPIKEDPHSGSGNHAIQVLLEDRDGNLWVGTAQNGLQLFDRVHETFTAFLSDPEDPNSLSNNTVNTIYQDREGMMWIGTNGGLNKYDPTSRHFSSFRPETVNPGHPGDRILALLEDNTGTFWVGSAGNVYRFDRLTERFTSFDLGTELPPDYSQVSCFAEDALGMLWMGTHWGMFKYNRSTNEMIHYLPVGLNGFLHADPDRTKFISNIYVRSIVVAGEKDHPVVWIATQWGLNRFDPNCEKFEAYFEDKLDPLSISNHFLLNLCLDESGLLWIGTISSGVDILNVNASPFHQVIMYLPDENVHCQPACFLMDHDENLWIGGIDMGLFQYDRDFQLVGNYSRWQFGIDTFDEKQHNQIVCICEGNDRILWLGFNAWGLVAFDRDKKTFTKVELPFPAGIPEPTIIENIVEDQEGVLWIGTNTGLYFKDRRDPVLDRAHPVEHDKLQKAEILRIAKDSKHNLWVSTGDGGLYCLQPENRDPLGFTSCLDDRSGQNGFSGSCVTAIYEDLNGILWLGSDKGLSVYNFNDRQCVSDTVFNKKYTGKIIRIFGDSQGHLWIFHADRGLIRYRPGTWAENAVRFFDIRDGLPFDGFNSTFHFANTFHQSEDGRLFLSSDIGSDDGFLWFYADSVKDNMLTPRMAITDFKVANNPFPLDSSVTVKRHITLTHNENFFSFEFAALDYLIPEKNQYAFYLEGLEDEWYYTGNQRSAHYTGVSPGHYTFRVKGSNNDGYWNESGVSLALTILPPPWRSWWAYTLYGLLLVGAIIAWRQYDLKRQRLKHALEIEHIEAQKLKELDSMKSRFFANISHEFRTPLTLILGPLQKLFSKTTDEESKQDIAIMQRHATCLQNLINQLLELSRLESGKMELQLEERDVIPLIKRYVQSFESLAKLKGIQLEFSAQSDGIPALVDPDKIEKILFNLLGNAFKWTADGGRILVEVGRFTGLQVYRSAGPRERGVRMEVPEDLKARRPSDSFDMVEILISDTGAGILPEKLPRIFDRFYQAGDSYTKDGEGTGIGLALTKELVELHGGTITVESVVNQGSTFRVFLPIGKQVGSWQLAVGNKKRVGNWQLAVGNKKRVGNGQLAVGNKKRVGNWQLAVGNKKRVGNGQLAVGNKKIVGNGQLAVGNKKIVGNGQLAVSNEDRGVFRKVCHLFPG
ncbi:MAG TPA: two-component regulator propeller domain-containing protein [Bacteroidales bacterium]|nr:two-component regulator propeller domain-containing protein [Bacteroidales bacterium]